MIKNKSRIKHCEICKKDFSVMYRIQYKSIKEWIFSCKDCLSIVKKTISFTNMVVLGKNKIFKRKINIQFLDNL